MTTCSSTLDRLSKSADRSPSVHLSPMPQWHIIMCRARWLVTPEPSDVPGNVESSPTRWLGPVKALLWMAVSIGVGVLIAGLD